MQKNDYYVYVYLNPLKSGMHTYGNFISFYQEPFYIGYGCGTRMSHHLKEKKSANMHKFYTIQKIRNNNLEPIVFKLSTFLTKKDACVMEKFFIKLIGRHDLNSGPLTNMTCGGDGGDTLSKHPKLLEIRKKFSDRAKKQNEKNWADIEFRNKQSKSVQDSYEKNGLRELRSIQAKELWRNPEYKAKQEESRKQRIYEISDATRKKLSDSHKGKTAWNRGIPATTEQRQKQSEIMKNCWAQKKKRNTYI